MATAILKKNSLLVLAIVCIWLKTVAAYFISFDMKLEGILQGLLLIINPISFILLIFGITFFMTTTRKKELYIIGVTAFLSLLLYGNIVFFRFYDDFITLPVLFQTSNFGDLGNSAKSIINWTDFLFFIDVTILYYLMKKKAVQIMPIVNRPQCKVYFIFVTSILLLNISLAEIERPQLFTRSFDRELLVKNIGTYNYHIYDIFIQSKSLAQRSLADGSELVEIHNYIRSNVAQVNPAYFGKYEGRNLIVVSLESLQNFVINETMDGQTITPFLNELTKDPDTYYFSEFYHQTGLGKTSDSEFIFENSLFGLGRGAVFFTHAGNTYNSLAEKVSNAGYSSNVMHANNRSFWNRDVIYNGFGIGNFYDIDSYDVNEQNSVNWGLKDIPFFEQSTKLLATLPKPFYSRLITLTNHYPFTLEEEDQMIPAYTSNSKTLNQYFQTARYLDESIKEFFEQLKSQGLYENSIIVLYGDHYGISENHNKAMAMYLNKEEITHYDSALLQAVPLFIHIPGSGEGKEIKDIAGQVDLRPTLLHLLGINSTKDIQLGADLFSKEHEQFVVFRDGRFITEDFVYTNEVCYSKETAEVLDISLCQPFIERSIIELEYSDAIINGDLLRFYDAKTGNLKLDALEQ